MKFLITLLALSLSLISYSQESIQKEIPNDSAAKAAKAAAEPQYPGGQTGWMEYVMKNMQYPVKAVNRHIQGAVLLQMSVDVDGSVSEIKITDGPKLLWDEAIKLVNNSGKWIPAAVNGQPVKAVKKTFIFFALEEVKKKEVGDMMNIKY